MASSLVPYRSCSFRQAQCDLLVLLPINVRQDSEFTGAMLAQHKHAHAAREHDTQIAGDIYRWKQAHHFIRSLATSAWSNAKAA